MMTMKRANTNKEADEVASCLILLSQRNMPRVFECKTCSRKFSSFQALGGHRASHKKPRLVPMAADGEALAAVEPVKSKTHECSICGLEFSVGQALGGHMRRHRPSIHDQRSDGGSLPPPPPDRRVLLSLDLNLTPFENDHLDLVRASQIFTYEYN